MDRTLIQEKAVRELMREWIDFLQPKGDFHAELVIDEIKKRFILMTEGWHDYRRTYGPMIDIALRDGKVWIHEDNTEEGVTDDLLAKGLKHEEIVIGWQPEYKRELTGFAVA